MLLALFILNCSYFDSLAPGDHEKVMHNKYIYKYVWPFNAKKDVLKDIPNIFSKISSSFYLIFVEFRHYRNHILVINEKGHCWKETNDESITKNNAVAL